MQKQPRVFAQGCPFPGIDSAAVAVVVLAAPVNFLGDLGLFTEGDIPEDILLKLLKAGAVHNVADVLLVLNRLRVDVLLDIGVGIRRNL